MKLSDFGFCRVSTISNQLSIGNPDFNAKEIINAIKEAEKNDVDVICFPELSLSSYTCGDLFYQKILLESVLDNLKLITQKNKKY